MKSNLPLGVILVGGWSQRMGSDKSQMILRDRPQVEHLYSCMVELLGEVVFSAREDQEVPGPKVVDEGLGEGPARGILSVHRAHPDRALMVVPCDVLEVDGPLLERLLGLEGEIVCFEDGSGLQPLPSVWSPKGLKKLRSSCVRGQYSLVRAMRFLALTRVELAQGLTNVNTPEELRVIKNSFPG